MLIAHGSKLTAGLGWTVLRFPQRPFQQLHNSAYMARRNEDFARLGSHGGYTQALTIGKGFSGAARRDARQQGSASSGQGGGGGGGGRGTMNAYARHQELIRNYHRYDMAWFLTCRIFCVVIALLINSVAYCVSSPPALPGLLLSTTSWYLYVHSQ